MASYSVGVLPSWVPTIESKPAPGGLLLLQAFVNTVEADTGIDLLDRPDTANPWLWDSGLVPRDVELGALSLQRAKEVREALRSLLGVNAGEEGPRADQLQLLATAGENSAVRLRIAGDDPYLIQPEAEAADPLDRAVAMLLLIIRDSQVEGTWARLKTCNNPECRWAYYDRSHSHRGRWCDMASCGNRLKNRALRARRV
jgi:predicted RNA-binding Zn ribbon-like protein